MVISLLTSNLWFKHRRVAPEGPETWTTPEVSSNSSELLGTYCQSECVRMAHTGRSQMPQWTALLERPNRWGTETSDQQPVRNWRPSWKQILLPSKHSNDAATAKIFIATSWQVLSQNHEPETLLDTDLQKPFKIIFFFLSM